MTFALVAAFLSAVAPTMVEQFRTMVRDLPAQAVGWHDRSTSLHRLADKFHVTSQIDGMVNGLPARVGNGLFGATGRVFSGLASAFTVAVLSVYFLADLPRLRRGAAWLSPPAYRDRLGRVVDVVVDKVGAYTVGNIAVSVIAGTAAFAALSALRVPLAPPLAFLVAVTDLIPSIGATTLGAAICVLYALLSTHTWQKVVVLAVFFVLYQLVENYLIAPRVMHGQVQLRAGAVLRHVDRRGRAVPGRGTHGDPAGRRGTGAPVGAHPGSRRGRHAAPGARRSRNERRPAQADLSPPAGCREFSQKRPAGAVLGSIIGGLASVKGAQP